MTTRSTTRRGRPLRLTPAVIEELGELVELGLTRSRAADVAGISRASLSRWMSRGREADKTLDENGAVPQGEETYWDLYVRIMKADAIQRVRPARNDVPVEVEPAVEEPTADPAPAGWWARIRSVFSSPREAAV